MSDLLATPLSAIALPVGSRIPPRDERVALGTVAAAIADAHRVVTGDASSGHAVRAALRDVARAAAGSLRALDAPMPPEASAVDDERAAFVRDAPHRLSDDALFNFAVYDAYFGVRRVPAMPARDIAASLLATLSVACTDVADALVGRDQIAALLAGAAAMLERLGSTTGAPAPANAAAEAGLPELPRDEHERVFLRWRTGHYVFALCAIHARDAFEAADFGAATTFVRATPAAMWYASEFPRAVYRDVVRPTMERAGSRGGFSGTHNADHARMAWARERAIEALFEQYGFDAAQWPAGVAAALARFNEAEVEAAEEHVLVAASKVDFDGSLAQKATGDPTSAVVYLREKAAAIASDVSERFVNKTVQRIRACAVRDVSRERPLRVDVAGRELIVCRAYGALWACDGICPHAGSDLGDGHMAGDAIVCALHGAKFDPRTGAVERGPAKEPLRTYPVTIEGDDVYVEMP